MSTRGLDPLALVSKLLLDQRVIELRQEVEHLRLRLFWKDHSMPRLVRLMAQANSYGDNAPKCACSACVGQGRIEDLDVYRNRVSGAPCSFAPWFKERLAQCGLTFQTISAAIGYQASLVGRPKFLEGYEVFDVDVHLLLGHDDQLCLFYGTKLSNAKSVKDPALQKLAALFKALQEGLGSE